MNQKIRWLRIDVQPESFLKRVDIMNATRRQRLNATMSDEPEWALGVVLKCAVCLAILTLLVVIGGNPKRDWAEQDARGNAPNAAMAAKLTGTAAHRKEVFDERRARFASSESDRHVAATAQVVDAEPPPLHAPSCSGGADGGMDATGNQCNAPGAVVTYTTGPVVLPHVELTKADPSDGVRPVALRMSKISLAQFRSTTLAMPVSRSTGAVTAPPPRVESEDMSKSTCSGGANGGMDATGNQCSE